MNEKEKAVELIQKFGDLASAVVVQIMCSNPHSNPFHGNVVSTMEWWFRVGEEIERLDKQTDNNKIT
jgi:hypothetical protein